jgi:hypothetical protein
LNTVGMQHSLNEQTIRFGPDDDSAKRVENVIIHFRDDQIMNVRTGFNETNFDNLTILKNCQELYFMFFKNKKVSEELYIPMSFVANVRVEFESKDTRSTKESNNSTV